MRSTARFRMHGGPGARPTAVGSLRLAAGLLAAAALACTQAPGVPPAPSRTLLEGLDYAEYAGTAVARRIHAAQVVVVARRLGVFQLSALSEVVLTRARIEVFEPLVGPGASPRAGMDAVVPREGFAVPGLADVRHLAGATFYGLEVVIARAGAAVARVGASHASAEARGGNLVLRDFRLEHLPSGRIVSAPHATWRRRTRDFVIPGAFTVEERGRSRSGRGLLVDGDFSLREP